jgi:hypothetical protein
MKKFKVTEAQQKFLDSIQETRDCIYFMQFKCGYVCGLRGWPLDKEASKGWKEGRTKGVEDATESNWS